MANKKCQKCGEDNPAEAVMCWACYTPLTAGAGASMGAGMGGATTMPRPGGPMGIPGAGVVDDGNRKKEIDPKLYLLGGLLVVGAFVGLFMSGVLGGSAPAAPPLIDVQTSSTERTFTTSGVSGPVVIPPPPAPPTNDNGQRPPPPQQSYTAIVAPNPKYTTATFGIVPAQPVGAEDAKNLARKARQDMAANGKWLNSQIFVFTDSASSTAFKQYMNARKGEPLGPNDYANLAGQDAWKGATLFYESRGNKEKTATPSANPRSWWTG